MEVVNYKFKKFDLVAGIRLNLGWGESASVIGIVDTCDDKTVTLSVVWSHYKENLPAWFIGNEIEFNLKKSYCWNSNQFYNNIVPIGELSFPFDLPGHYPIGGVCFESGRRAYAEAKKRGKIADRQQFQDLLSYVRLYGKENISKAIIEFFDKEGWSDYANTFIQGVHKDGREWNEGKGQVQALIYI